MLVTGRPRGDNSDIIRAAVASNRALAASLFPTTVASIMSKKKKPPTPLTINFAPILVALAAILAAAAAYYFHSKPPAATAEFEEDKAVDVWLDPNAASVVGTIFTRGMGEATHYKVATCTANRSVLVVKGSKWMPKGKPRVCFSQETAAAPDASYKRASAPVGTECRYSTKARMNALHAFKADKAITMVLESAFGAVPGTCVPSREAEEKNGDTGKTGIFSYLTNSSKALGDAEDSLHSDISGGEDGAICASGCTDVYITAIGYPHDDWQPTMGWGGQTEFAGRDMCEQHQLKRCERQHEAAEQQRRHSSGVESWENEPVAFEPFRSGEGTADVYHGQVVPPALRVSPMPRRTILFDALLAHRSTWASDSACGRCKSGDPAGSRFSYVMHLVCKKQSYFKKRRKEESVIEYETAGITINVGPPPQ